MTPTLKQVRALVALYKHRHFGNAASELCISQPALSRTIQDFERVVDGPLVDRSCRHVQLTPLGERFAKLGEELLRAWEENFDGKNPPACKPQRPGKIAMGPALATLLAPELLRKRYRPQFDQSVSILVGSCRKVMASVYDGDVDVGVCSLVEGPHVHYEELLASRIGILTSKDVPIGSKSVVPGDVASLNLIKLKADGFIYNMLAAHCPELITAMTGAPEINDLGTILQVIKSGLASAIVSAVTASNPVANELRFVPFSHDFMQRKFHMVCKRGQQHDPIVSEMFQNIREAVASVHWHPGVELLCPQSNYQSEIRNSNARRLRPC